MNPIDASQAQSAAAAELTARVRRLIERGAFDAAAGEVAAALGDSPADPAAHCAAGYLALARGDLAGADGAFRAALGFEPGSGAALLGLGRTCYERGSTREALDLLERSLRVEPGNAETLSYCGLALGAAGHSDLALTFARRAIEAAPDCAAYRRAAIEILQGVDFVAADAWYERFLIDCLDDPALAHDSVTHAALSMLWIKPAMRAAREAAAPAATHLAALEREPLLLRLLAASVVRSWPFEQFFSRLRQGLVARGAADLLALRAAVAEQAFNTGYVQRQSAAEAELEQRLLGRSPESLTAVEWMMLAAYRPLADVPGADRLAAVAGDLPEPCRRVIRRTLAEPLAEREIRPRIGTVTPIRDAVSLRVQAQYEEHPYPRWLHLPPAPASASRLAATIARQVPGFDPRVWPDRPAVLVPGCGTGFQPLTLASRHPEADILAIDLSRTSLAYALRKRDELGLDNVRFRHGDLLELADLPARFDYIDCAGVLHHMESPLAGWRVLANRLTDAGVMRIGLYSELARRHITAARDKVAELGIASTPDAIRRFRHDLMHDPALADLRPIAATAGDFFSMGEVRDLIFHEQEHRFDLPAIGRALAALGFEFRGFVIEDRAIATRFRASYPAPAQWLDLACWHEFETRNPDTFLRMYQFYCTPG